MHWQIQAPGMTMDIVEPKSSHSDDTIQQFTGQEEAARFLEVFSITWQNFDKMIAAIQSTGEAASAGSHQEVANQLARLIVTDRLRLRRSNHATDEVSRGPFGMKLGVWMDWNPAQVQKSSSTESPKAPANDKIEIKVVDDQTGRVVPGVLLDLQVPGGFIEPHTTRQSGLVESLGLESGECKVSCDIKDLTLKNSLVFVGVGDDPIEKAPEDSKATGILDTEPGSRYLIALVEKHKMKKGDHVTTSICIMAHTYAHDLMRFNIQIEPQSLGKKK